MTRTFRAPNALASSFHALGSALRVSFQTVSVGLVLLLISGDLSEPVQCDSLVKAIFRMVSLQLLCEAIRFVCSYLMK